MTAHSSRFMLSLAVMGLATLACATVQRVFEPEPTATPTVAGAPTTRPSPTRRATATPVVARDPSLTPGIAPTATPGALPTLAPLAEDVSAFRAAMRPEFAQDVVQFAAATRYSIEVTVTFEGEEAATLTGSERVRYTNHQPFALSEIYLMLWPNGGEQYLSQMTLGAVTLNGQPVTPEMESADLAARIALPEPLAPGASVELTAAFTIQAAAGIDASGAARFGLTNGVLLAPTFYPLIPRIVEGQWQTRPAPSGGDTTNSDTALYAWRVTAPAALAIVATGSVVERSVTGETQTQTLVSGPMRDLALVVGPLAQTTRQAGAIAINVYVLDPHAEMAEKMLDYTEAQIKTLEAEVGPYPFAELDVVDAPGAFGGIEYPGEIFIGVVDDAEYLERVVAHETGHQWFYSLIGDDQLLEPWLDEAAASYTEVLYAEKVQGRSAARTALGEFKAELAWLDSEAATLPIGLPVDGYASEMDYGIIVYSKGALFFDALRTQLGEATFFRFLRDYYTRYRYGFATAADFQAAAETTCACDLNPLFDLWVYKGGK